MEFFKRNKKAIIAFGGIILAALVCFFAFCLPQFIKNGKREQIRQNGVRANGYNLQYGMEGVSFGGDNYYLQFEYFVDGEKRTGKTAAVYTETECATAVMRGTLSIIYNDDGAVERTFDRKKADGAVWELLSVICGAAIGLSVLVVIMIFKDKKQASK